MKQNKMRLNLVISQSTKDMISELQQRTNASNMTEVIKRALALYDTISKEQLDGTELVFKKFNEDGTSVESKIVVL